MKLQEKLRKDLTSAIKTKDEHKKEALRVILGEMGRGDKKELSDEEIVKVLRKLIKSEKELLERKGGENESDFIRVIENYLPQMATDNDIRAWIELNVDFSKYKNKMQAMSDIMRHFGLLADGNAVKNILKEF